MSSITDPGDEATAANAGRGRLVARTADARLPTEWGEFRCHGFDCAGETHLAIVAGDVRGDVRGDIAGAAGVDEPVLVRVHSECLTGDVFGSAKCDCGPQLHESMRRIAEIGRGVVVYLRGHEGRGIGLRDKLRAYELQDEGYDTVDANIALGLPVDDRDYGIAAAILADLGVRRLRLLTNNPAKCRGLQAYGLTVTDRVPLQPVLNPEAEAYLRTKRDRMGHLLPTDREFGP